MTNSLIIIGKELIYNKPYMTYAKEELNKHIEYFDTEQIINKNDSDFFIKLEDTISKFDQTVILCTNHSFTFVNKVISTINDDRLELKEDMLIPSKTILYSKDSYLIKKDEKIINVLSLRENEKFPEILIKDNLNYKNFSIINIDIDSAKLLIEPICSTYEIKIEATAVIDGWIEINASSFKYGNLDNFIKALKNLFSDKFIDNADTIEYIIRRIEKNGKKITAVESCTGGLICSMITKIAGSSSVFDGGIVSYANQIKESWVGVSKETLEKYGAVSENCVQEMLEGILCASGADFALATSGIAGPGGGSDEKPVGTVFVGVKSKNNNAKIQRLLLKGDRHYIQKQSAYHAFKLLLESDKKTFF
ncbi:MAG: CinA family protein [Sulfurospirillum sp.]